MMSSMFNNFSASSPLASCIGIFDFFFGDGRHEIRPDHFFAAMFGLNDRAL